MDRPDKPDLSRLVEEFPLTSAMVAKDMKELEAFLHDPTYESWVKDGGSLAFVFGGWLASRAKDFRASTVASLELALARLRRQREFPAEEGDRLTLSSRAVVVDRPPGTAALHAELTTRLGPGPARSLPAGGLDRRGLPPLGVTGIETLLLLRAGKSLPGGLPEVIVEQPDAPTSALLVFAQEPRTRSELREEARAVGAEEDLVDKLLARGLLERCK